ncbi:MAG TPA: hypothetical protein VH561_00090 [Micromonosporaceae bacterium]
MPDETFGTAIQTAIDGREARLVILTPDAAASLQWVRRGIGPW